jgi:adenylate kinase
MPLVPPRSVPTVRAVLLLGRSSSGKSPLGERIERVMSSRTRRFLHLDFGALLRGVCLGAFAVGFSPAQVRVIRSHTRGRLLDRRTFWVARRLVAWFLAQRSVAPSRDILVLNGLPRHQGQARELARLGIAVRLVVHLACPVRTAWQRKCLAERGEGHEDRAGRSDGTRDAFLRRVRSFARQTLPLVEYYRARGVPVARVTVRVGTSPAAMLRRLRDTLAAV